MWFDPLFLPSLWTVVALGLAIWAFRRTGAAAKQIAALQGEVKALAERLAPVQPPSQTATAAAEQALEPIPVPITEEPQRPRGKVWGGSDLLSEPEVAAAPPPVEPAAAAPARDIEQRFAARWLVWLGGIAIAIGGVLFVKYAVDNGLLPPALRCTLGLVAGAVLAGGAEWLRRTPSQRAIAAAGPDYVPPALAAAGLLIAFASIYAAHAWYGLIGPATAFAGAALIAFAAFALALVQGPLIAALGLIAAYGTPMLIPSADPSAWKFFPYLLIVLAACFAILRRRIWWWLGYAALLGTLGWTLLWLRGGVFEAADQLPIGLFLLVLGGVATFGIAGRAILDESAGSLAGLHKASQPFRIAAVGIAVAGLGLCALVHAGEHSNISLVILLAGAAGAVALAWVAPGFARLARVTGAVVFLTLMVWKDAAFFSFAMDEFGEWTSALGPGASRFLGWMLAFGGIFMLTGLAGVRLRPEPVAWASLGGAAPVVFTIGAWARVAGVLPEAQWAALAGIAAALLIAAIWIMRERISDTGMNTALGLLVIAAAILATFAFDRLLDGVWLTLAIAALVPVLALAGRRLAIALIGPIAAAVASLAALRLFFSRELFLDRRDLPLGAHWMLYGYGLPAVMFWQSSRWMRDTYARSAMALEGAALALAIALVSLELRVLIAGGVTVDKAGLLETSAHIMAWLGAAYGLMHRLAAAASPVRLWGARLLLAASCFGLVISNLGGLNPVFSEEPIEGNVVFNTLLLAYLAPTILLGLIAIKLPAVGWRKVLPAIGVLALALVLAYVTLETKRWFQGRLMVIEPLSQAESYAYSAVWLATALALLVAGIRFDSPPVRYGGLAIIVLTVLKVFLADMSDLEGLYRIASFAGLGLCLVGIGYLYTRFLHRPKPA